MLAFAATAVTLALRLAMDGPLDERRSLVMFTMPIMLSAYAGGLRAGLLATLLSLLGAGFFLMPPIHSFAVASAGDRWQLFFLLVSGVFICILSEAMHRARLRSSVTGREGQDARDDRDRFFTLSQDVLCILGFDGYFKDVNPAWGTTLGYTRSELLATPFISFVHPDDRPTTLAEADKVAGGKALVAFENRYQHKDGSYRLFQWNVTPVIESGVMYGVARDITERKHREVALRASEKNLSTILESMSEGVMLLDAKGNVSYRNRASLRLAGFEPSETGVIKTSQALPVSWEAWDEQGRPVHSDEWPISRVTRGENFQNQVLRTRRGDTGHEFIACYNGRRIFDDSEECALGLITIHDITEREAARKALQNIRDRLVLATESASIGIWDYDLAANKLAWDARMYVLYGIAEQDFSGAYEAWRQGLHPEDLARSDAETAAALEGSAEYHTEFRVIWPDGTIHNIEAHALVQRADDGSAARVIGVNWDITPRKRAEAALAQAQYDLVQSSRQAGMAEVATNVLHNVGNALNSVNVSASLVVETIKTSRAASMAKVVAMLREHTADLGSFITSDSKGQHIPAFLEQISGDWLRQEQTQLWELESLRVNIDHIKVIVAMQQSYARVSGVSERVSVRELVEDSLRVKEASLREHHVRVIRKFEAVPEITVEKHRALQILVTLVQNARLACDERDDADKHITLRIVQAGDHVRISVSDNGIGIAPENLTRIFAHGFTTRKVSHGFGLHGGALAATELGGSLSVRSDGLGHGATFTLELPMQPPGARA